MAQNPKLRVTKVVSRQEGIMLLRQHRTDVVIVHNPARFFRRENTSLYIASHRADLLRLLDTYDGLFLSDRKMADNLFPKFTVTSMAINGFLGFLAATFDVDFNDATMP